MSKSIANLCEGLESKIAAAYEEAPTIPEAEKLAAEFLHAQMQIANELREVALDARMRKSGLKAVKSAERMSEVKKHEKKPTEGHLEDIVNLSKVVQEQQDGLDAAEVSVEYLENWLNILRDAHIYFRGIAKGRFE